MFILVRLIMAVYYFSISMHVHKYLCSVQNQTLLEACSLLLSEASMKMKKSSHKDNSLGLLKALVPLVLLAHNKCIIPDSEINKHKGGSDGAIFEQLTLMLGVWITSKDVMGSESFGGKDDTFYSSWRGKDELKVNTCSYYQASFHVIFPC